MLLWYNWKHVIDICVFEKRVAKNINIHFSIVSSSLKYDEIIYNNDLCV
jgi:hypothetical protein